MVACIFDKVYATGKKVAAGFKESVRIVFDQHLRQWNYTAVPHTGINLLKHFGDGECNPAPNF